MVIAEILRVTASRFSRKYRARTSSGDSLVVEGVGLGGSQLSVDLIAQAGIVSRPAKDAIVVALPVGEGRKTMFGIAAHNYQINFIIAEGETTIFSTSADGKTIKARIDLDNTGKIKISNEAQSLHNILDTLIFHIKTFAGGNCVSGSPLSTSAAFLTAIDADKAKLDALLKD